MLLLIGIVLLIGGGIFYANSLVSTSTASSETPTTTARITTLLDKVVEQGTLESQKTVIGKCEIDDSENKIIFLAPEGSFVKKGEVVVRFDDSKIKERIAERESSVNEAEAAVASAEKELDVQKDENETSIRTAKQTFELATIDLDKYMEGDSKVSLSENEQAISEAKTEVAQANRDMENTRKLVKGGFAEYQQLEDANQVVNSANLRLINAQQKLDTFKNYEFVKNEAEFTSKKIEAEHALKVAKSTATAKEAKAQDQLTNAEAGLVIQQNRLNEMKKDLARHEMKAPQDGTLTYAQNWREDDKVREGHVLYNNQHVFILPDMRRMQVKVGIHETLVSKVSVGQAATIKVDAFSGITLTGTVKSVSQMSDSTRWERSNNYQVFVTIDSFPEDVKLKPGMNAEVEILAGKYPDQLAVPIQAVTSFGQRKYVFIQNASGEFEPREAEIGKSTISFVAIKSGLSDGDVVALDAYQRGLVEFNTEDPDKMLKVEFDEMEKSENDGTEATASGSSSKDKSTTDTELDSATEPDSSESIEAETNGDSNDSASEGSNSKSAAGDAETQDAAPEPGPELETDMESDVEEDSPTIDGSDTKTETPMLEESDVGGMRQKVGVNA